MVHGAGDYIIPCQVSGLLHSKGGSGPWSIKEYQFFPIFLLLLHCVPLYDVCRLCINFQELCARLLGMATLRIRFSPSFHAL